MIRSPINTAMAALLILGATSAHAEMLDVNITSNNGYAPPGDTFGGISFQLNTADTADTITTGNITLAGTNTPESSSVYVGVYSTGGVSNGSLIWNGVSYSLQSAAFGYYYDGDGFSSKGLPDSDGPYNLDIFLNFTNGLSFDDQNQESVNALSVSQYNPSQFLAAAMLKAYNGGIVGGFLYENGDNTRITPFVAQTTPVSEPGALALLAVGIAGLALSRRRIKA